MMIRKAVIDLGSNTFNLFIADVSDSKNEFEIVFHEENPVRLGKGSFNQHKKLTLEAIERAIKVLEDWKAICTQFQVQSISAIGTSALRDASNGNEFLKLVQQKTGIEIKIISGLEEAVTIYKGVSKAVAVRNDEKILIMDIGGGSTEFIIADAHDIIWHESYNLGAVRLIEKFTPSDPISNDEIQQFHRYFDSTLSELLDQCKKHNPSILIGCSGAFESIRDVIFAKKNKTSTYSKQIAIPQFDFLELKNEIISSNSAYRTSLQGLHPMRVDTIVTAIVFVDYVMSQTNISQLVQTDYSLKEGVLLS